MLVRIAIGLFLSGLLALGSEMKRDEAVIFFPTVAQQTEGGWKLEIHGWVFEPGAHKMSTSILRRALGIDEEELSAAERKTFAERTRFFLADSERRKTISIRLGAKQKRLSASGPNGHFKGRIDFGEDEFHTLCRTCPLTNGLLAFQTISDDGSSQSSTGIVHLVEETGVSVISDIDDTIKVSQVLDRSALVRNTFYRPFQAVPGMASAYQAWSGLAHAKFHYVSASPWQLYAPLAEFARDNGFPAGTFHLKDFRLKDKTFFDLFRSPERYKSGVIEPFLERFPKRRFVLVGDSGEKDPEIYAAIARKYPKQIARIFIRDVTEETAGSQRYQQAFQGLPTGLCRIFREPSEIENALP